MAWSNTITAIVTEGAYSFAAPHRRGKLQVIS